ALVLRREGTSVYRINDDVCGDDETPCQTAEQISVVTGLGDGTMIQISGDVHPGDSVVVRGAERLRPGQPVTVTGSSENLTAGGQVAEPAT
ncbi:MAG: efflux transporter periplasmic adaptor subunit, partial [Gammaproteobacteria bacterium]